MIVGKTGPGQLDLDLEFARAESAGDPFAFQFTPQDYLLRTEGGGFQTLRVDWNEALLADLAAISRPGADPAVRQRLGETLRRFLQPTSWSAQEAQIVAAAQGGVPITLTLRSAAAEIYALPWELLTLRASGQHLGEIPQVLLRYAWPETAAAPAEPALRKENGRILFAWSAAAGAVPAAEHLQAIERASQIGFYPFDPERDMLPHASPGQIVAALTAARREGNPISVLHLLCHGAAADETFGLGWNADDPEEGLVLVDAGRLRQLLAPFAGMVRLVVIAACDSGNAGAVGNHLGSVAQTLHRAGIAQVVASRYLLPVPGSVQLTEAFYAELLGGPASVEDSLLAARRRLALDPKRADWASLQLYAHAAEEIGGRPVIFRPYRGLLAFQAAQRRFFFGRDREIDEVVSELEALRDKRAPILMAVDGASGTGKSSMIFAGALPRLLEVLGPGASARRMRPGTAPMAALDEALSGRDDEGPTLLVIDQFEELFTHVEAAEERRAFARRVWELAGSADARVSVLITLRSDFVGRCGELVLEDGGLRLDRVIYDESRRVSVAQMAPAQMREVIEGPAARVGLRLEQGLTERMLRDVEGEPGALPLLSHTLDLLWQQREGDTLTQSAYDRIGGVIGALNGHADQILASLSGDERKEARRLLVRLGGGLVDGAHRVRLRVRVSSRRPTSAPQAEHFDRALARLVEARLLTLDRDGEEKTVEVAHEALLRKWPLLAQWAKEDRQMLLQLDAMEGWVKEWHRHDTLLRGDQLGYAVEVAARYRDALSADAAALLAESQAVRAKEEERAAYARDCQRMLAASSLYDDPTRQAAILREMESADPIAVPGWVTATTDILRREVLTTVEMRGHTNEVGCATFSPDGELVATASVDGTARVWRAEGDADPIVLSGHDGAVSWVIWSPDGRALLTASEDCTARLWPRDGGRAPRILDWHEDEVTSVAFSRDGGWIVTASADRSAALWRADRDEEPWVIAEHKDRVNQAAFSPDGTRIVTASADGTARITSVQGDREPLVLAGHKRNVTSAEFTPSGRHVITTSEDGTARIWSATGRGEPIVLDGRGAGAPTPIVQAAVSPDGRMAALALKGAGLLLRDMERGGRPRVLALPDDDMEAEWIAFSPDSKLLVATYQDGSASLWYTDNLSLPFDLRGHLGAVLFAAFSPDGKRIVTASFDGTARLWDATRTALHMPTLLRRARRGAAKAQRDDAFVWSAGTGATSEARSADGKRQAVAAADGTVRVEERGGPTTTLPADGGPVAGLQFSPEGDRLVTLTDDNRARVWPLAGGPPVVLSGHSNPIVCVDFSPDGKRIVTGAADWQARVWKSDAGGAPVVLAGHTDTVDLAVFSPDGSRILTMSHDGTTMLWGDGGRGEILMSEGMDFGVAIRSDWTKVVTEIEDGSQFLWDLELDPAAIIRRLWRATPFCLSVEERERHLREPHDLAVQNHQASTARAGAAAQGA